MKKGLWWIEKDDPDDVPPISTDSALLRIAILKQALGVLAKYKDDKAASFQSASSIPLLTRLAEHEEEVARNVPSILLNLVMQGVITPEQKAKIEALRKDQQIDMIMKHFEYDAGEPS